MKHFNLIMALVFVLFAALQYNDPDPWLWIPIYMYAAVLCALFWKAKFYPKAYVFGVIVYLAYAVWLIFTRNGVIDWYTEHNAENLVQTMKAEKPWIEDTREFGGLLILITVLTLNYFYTKRKSAA